MVKLYIVVPCYNEYEVLEETTKRLSDKLFRMQKNGLITEESKIVYVDDGSKDDTWRLICNLKEEYKNIIGIKLSRNKGHQNALLAGLMTVKDSCDAVVSMDADLQDDIEILDKFVEHYKNGCEIVYGVRKERSKDTAFKRESAQGYYKLLKFFGVDIVYNHADFRLMSKKALDALESFGEVNLFLRGIVPLIGYKSATVEYERGERPAGVSKYPLKKMIEFGFDGITSFSIRPMRIILLIGLAIFIVSLAMLMYSLVSRAMGNVVTGWTSIMMSIWLLGGLQLAAIGIIGEYIGKVYLETKKRPKYIIEKIIE